MLHHPFNHQPHPNPGGSPIQSPNPTPIQADIELLQKEEKETSIELSKLRDERDMVDAELAELEVCV